MTINTVLLTFGADASPADPTHAEGNVVAIPSGELWPDTNNNPIVPMVVHGTLGDGLNGGTPGEAVIQLASSDSFAAGVLTWDIVVNIRGLPTVNVSGVVVDFSNGASQNGWTVLKAAGWTPVNQP